MFRFTLDPDAGAIQIRAADEPAITLDIHVADVATLRDLIDENRDLIDTKAREARDAEKWWSTTQAAMNLIALGVRVISISVNEVLIAAADMKKLDGWERAGDALMATDFQGARVEAVQLQSAAAVQQS